MGFDSRHLMSNSASPLQLQLALCSSCKKGRSWSSSSSRAPAYNLLIQQQSKDFDYYLHMIPSPDTGHLSIGTQVLPPVLLIILQSNSELTYWSSAQLSYWIHHVSNLSRIAVEVTTTTTITSALVMMINLHHRDRIMKWWTLFIASYIFLPGLAAYHASWCYFFAGRFGTTRRHTTHMKTDNMYNNSRLTVWRS